jgi:NAD(P)-dependent dehydrogenase (short-subunit alcohol dehydrogenase family)
MTREQPREKAQEIDAQQQDEQPGTESEMGPHAEFIRENYRGSAKLEGKAAIVTGGDSGIGRAAALHFAREGADVAVIYLDEHEDAEETAERIEAEGGESLLLSGDVRDSAFCRAATEEVVDTFDGIDVLVNNAAQQVVQTDLTEISDDQWEETFATNMHGYFYLTRAVLPYLDDGNTIINTTSINAFVGSGRLVDYSSTKGGDRCLHAFALTAGHERGDPRQPGRPRADLDAADPGDDRTGRSRRRRGVRHRRPDGATGPTLRTRAGVRLPRLRGFVLYERTDDPSQRRNGTERVREG